MSPHTIGAAVTITVGAWGGRVGTITAADGDVYQVEFTAPRLLLDPDGEQQTLRLPFHASELQVAMTYLCICGFKYSDPTVDEETFYAATFAHERECSALHRDPTSEPSTPDRFSDSEEWLRAQVEEALANTRAARRMDRTPPPGAVTHKRPSLLLVVVIVLLSIVSAIAALFVADETTPTPQAPASVDPSVVSQVLDVDEHPTADPQDGGAP